MECETIEMEQAPAGKKMRPSDFEEYDTLVDQLAERLKIARHPDSSVTIKAARLLIESILTSPFNAAKKNNNKQQSSSGLSSGENEIRIQQSKFNLDDVSLPANLMSNIKLGTTTDDNKKDELKETFGRAAKSLKLLYLDDQKQLQFRVNEIISAIQSVTANPKTDSRLVSIGR